MNDCGKSCEDEGLMQGKETQQAQGAARIERVCVYIQPSAMRAKHTMSSCSTASSASRSACCRLGSFTTAAFLAAAAAASAAAANAL